MRLFTTILLVSLSGRVAEEPQVQQASIIEGRPAAGAYPAVGLVIDVGKTPPGYLCSGILITADTVLTAAHCMTNPSASLGFAIAENFETVDSTEIVSAKQLTVHPHFLGMSVAPPGASQVYDLGLLTLEQPLRTVTPLPLASPAQVESLGKGAKLLLVGAGPAELDGSDGKRHIAEVSLAVKGGFELEVAPPGEPQPCMGDSGGPLLVEFAGHWRVVGLISRSKNPFSPCREGAVATRVDPYLDFIRKHATLPCGSADVPACKDMGAASPGDGGTTDGAAATTHDMGSTDLSGAEQGVVPGGRYYPGGSKYELKDKGCAVAQEKPHALWFWVALLLLYRRQKS